MFLVAFCLNVCYIVFSSVLQVVDLYVAFP